MQKRIPLIVIVGVLLVFTLAIVLVPYSQARSAHLGYASQPQRPYDPHTILVKFEPGVQTPLSARAGARHLFGSWWRLPVAADEDPADVMMTLAQQPGIDTVELNYLISLDQIETQALAAAPLRTQNYPDDTYYSYQWHLPMVQSDASWALSRGAGVTVAVIDTGVSRGDDLACRNFVSPYSALTDTASEAAAADENGHGTHVAGTIGQCTNNGHGVAGMAPDVNLMPVRVLDGDGNGTLADVAEGINWAVTHHADVINLSLGMPCNGATWPTCSQTILNDAIDNAVAADVVIVAAAGNSHGSTPYFPANHPDVLAVAAVDYAEQRTFYSNGGNDLSLSAPGGDINADLNHDDAGDGVLQQTFHNNVWGYYYFEGTSMASPHVAGAAALLRAYAPDAYRDAIINALLHTTKDLGDPGFDADYGYGLLQTADALAYLLTSQTATPAPSPTANATAPPTTTPSPTATPTMTPVMTPLSQRVYLPLFNHILPTPTATPSPTSTTTPAGIYGRVTYNLHPGAGIHLELRRYNAQTDEKVAETYANGNGDYQFLNAPTLPAGSSYYVRYGPNESNPDYLWVWFGPDINAYQQGQAVAGGDFDIANVQLLSPPDGSTQNLPVTFTWRQRVASGDTYRFILFEPGTNNAWMTGDLGNTDRVVINALPAEVQRNKFYTWYPRPYRGSDSYGLPFDPWEIAFASSAQATSSTPARLPATKRAWQMPTARGALWSAPSPYGPGG